MSDDQNAQEPDPELDQAARTLFEVGGWAAVYSFVEARKRAVTCPRCRGVELGELVTVIDGKAHPINLQCSFCEKGVVHPGRMTLWVDGNVIGRVPVQEMRFTVTPKKSTYLITPGESTEDGLRDWYRQVFEPKP